MSKLEYDNFPKFIVSLGIVLFVFPIILMHFFMQENTVLIVTEQELSQLTPVAKQAILAKQQLGLFITDNMLWISITFVMVGIALLVLGCKMWYSHQKKIDAKQDVELQTARVQLQKMTTEEKDEKIGNEVLSLEQSNSIENSHNEVEELSVEEIRKRQEAIRKENGVIYQQIKLRYVAAENAVIDRIKRVLATQYTIQDNVKINNLVYDAIAISKDTDSDYIIEVKYLFSSTSWNTSSMQSTLYRIISQVKNYTHGTGRSAKAILLIITLADQIDNVSKMIKTIPEDYQPITVRVIDEKKIGLLNIENIL